MIKHTVDRPLRTIALTIEKVAVSSASHQTSRPYILYELECMAPSIFNWTEGLLVSLKDQITKCWRGEIKQFGYEEVVVSLFMERVALLHTQVSLNSLEHEGPWLLR